MIKNTKNLSFTFSPKALLLAVPAIVLFRIQEFLLSLGSSVTLVFGIYTTLEKQKNYTNFKNFTHTKLNCLTVLECETPKTYYLFFKEQLITYYTNILSLYKRNTFNYFRRVTYCIHCVFRQVLSDRFINFQRDYFLI